MSDGLVRNVRHIDALFVLTLVTPRMGLCDFQIHIAKKIMKSFARETARWQLEEFESAVIKSLLEDLTQGRNAFVC